MKKEDNPWRNYRREEIPTALNLFPLFFRWFKPQERILDLGCGPGRTVYDLVARGFSGLTAADINIAGVTAAASDPPPGLPFRPDWLAGDGAALPFRDDSFDGIIMQAVLTTIVDLASRRTVMGEAARVLKPGGRLYLAAFGQTWDSPIYRARYEQGMAAGYPAGTFDAPDASGGVAYAARHFTRDELVELAESVGLELLEYSPETFTTRTGKKTAGHVLILAAG